MSEVMQRKNKKPKQANPDTFKAARQHEGRLKNDIAKLDRRLEEARAFQPDRNDAAQTKEALFNIVGTAISQGIKPSHVFSLVLYSIGFWVNTLLRHAVINQRAGLAMKDIGKQTTNLQKMGIVISKPLHSEYLPVEEYLAETDAMGAAYVESRDKVRSWGEGENEFSENLEGTIDYELLK